MLKFILITFLLGAGAAQAQFTILPEVFRVTGVATDDTLNVRASPSASAKDIGDIYPNEVVEIIALSDDSKWGKIVWNESNAWVSMRFLNADPLSTMPDSDMPLGLTCSGTEPFWRATIWTNKNLEFVDYASDSLVPSFQRITQSTNASGFAPISFAFTAGEFTGLLERAECSDGMSDITFGWQVRLINAAGGNLQLRRGCCRAGN